MRWPETARLIKRIRAERPELTVEYQGSGTRDQFIVRVYCIVKQDAQGESRLIPDSLGTFYSPADWKRYRDRHSEPWCKPEESYHIDALGREVDHHGRLVVQATLPHAPQLTADEMFEHLARLRQRDREWWKNPEMLAEAATLWGVQTTRHGFFTHYEMQEVARLGPDCYASVFIARTGCGLFAYGIAARWGNGGTSYQPSVCSTPFDTQFEARRAAFKELIATLERRGPRHRQRQLLLEAVRARDKQRGLFD